MEKVYFEWMYYVTEPTTSFNTRFHIEPLVSSGLGRYDPARHLDIYSLTFFNSTHRLHIVNWWRIFFVFIVVFLWSRYDIRNLSIGAVCNVNHGRKSRRRLRHVCQIIWCEIDLKAEYCSNNIILLAFLIWIWPNSNSIKSRQWKHSYQQTNKTMRDSEQKKDCNKYSQCDDMPKLQVIYLKASRMVVHIDCQHVTDG